MRRVLFVLATVLMSAWSQGAVAHAWSLAPDGGKPIKSEANLKEYVDETYNVVYTYDPDGTTAQVKAGASGQVGSPDASGDITILDKIVDGGKEYVVSEIGEMAFWGNYNIDNVTLPSTIASIGKAAFQYSSLKTINLPADFERIEAKTFEASWLQVVDLPEHLQYIGEEAFRDTRLKTITIPATVHTVEAGAFAGCDSMKAFSVDENNSVYDSREQCNALIQTRTNTLVSGFKSTTIPSSVERIGSGAFFNSEIESIEIPEGVKEIEGMAFFSAWKLKSITLPQTLVKIGGQAFAYCSRLKSITIPDGVKTIGYRCFAESGLESIEFPPSIELIEGIICHRCLNLVSVTIPSSITGIDMIAFYECPSLRTVFCNVAEPFDIHENVFLLNDSTFTSAILYVPAGTKELYEQAAGWKKFQNIVEMGQDDPDDEELTAKVVIWTKDGEKCVYLLKEEPKISFTQEELLIETATMSATYPLSEFRCITYKEDDDNPLVTGIMDVEDGNGRFGESLSFVDMAEGTPVSIYSANGTLVSEFHLSASHRTLSLSGLPQGIYLVKVNNMTYKIRKK
ncbi:MAG: leucine-rich repeat domain-containing protein [Bacteroidaceae bacterium]|nr:leucine-rich repeat domain-containing protein [Bacteroidaceae bacterium]